MFKWIPFYEELADKLLEYKNKPKRLVNLIYKHFDSEDASFLYDDSKKEMPIFEEIDPFTIYSIFNRNKGTRSDLAQTMKDAFEISAESPLTFEGIPVQNYSNLSFVARHKAADGDAKRLWQLFELALSQDAEQEDVGKVFDRVLKQLCIGMAKITMGLYYIRPYDFLALDGNNVNYLDNYGIIVDPKKMNYADYVNLMNEVKVKMKDKTIKEQSFPEFSLAAVGENYNEEINNEFVDEYVDLLRANHNLILTGAPGTGKTYLAKQIAQAMGCTDNEIGFVQFHPSYDYTDFVEGLRPLDDGNGNVGFERKDGVFKEFCAKALENLTDSQKSLQTLQQETSVRDLIDDFVQDAIDSDLKLATQGTKNVFHIIENKAKHITIDIPKNEKTRVIALPKSDLITLLENKVDISGSKDIQLYFQRKYRTQQDSYTYVLYEKLKSLESKTKVETVSLIPKKNFVFIIDEINRGEINKIFGELFFSIDPGYRGEKGRVQTQYQNMVEDGDAFKKGFFVPENVYIIGTMNDIDRSVESMDFAFRRRFAFKEVTADDSKAMLDDFEWKDDAVKRMDSLNAAIEKIEGLSSAYHIGASYFLKLKNYNGDFGQLWDCHLKGLLFEYLRGTQSVDENMQKLEKAYNLNNTAADDSDTDN